MRPARHHHCDHLLLFYCWDFSRFLHTVADSFHTALCDETQQFRWGASWALGYADDNSPTATSDKSGQITKCSVFWRSSALTFITITVLLTLLLGWRLFVKKTKQQTLFETPSTITWQQCAYTNARAFNGPLSPTTWVSWYQKGKTNLDFTEQTVSGSCLSWAICKSAPRSRQIAMPAPTTQFFTGRMPFLSPNQQHQSTEDMSCTRAYKNCDGLLTLPLTMLVWVDLCPSNNGASATSSKLYISQFWGIFIIRY